ncbi:heptaprenyl diphosphate synthase component II [Jeotgalibacillus marinus]|uniref:Heptaprenyl diphosphate synthase component II n=1 Tax=Jeotgalibacillus marinus TaxID=86667 RepID=A0ABV3Q072_9BACL
MKLKMLYSFLKTDIEEIEKELNLAIDSDTTLLKEASLHLLQAGGKRIRPVFVLLAAKTGEYDIHVIKNVGVALELIHMASLVHDDVIDNAELRRGRTTIKAEWDNQVAMYTGDYMFARALDYMTIIEQPIAHKILSNSIVELCIGEIAQIQDKYRFDQTLRDYLRRIRRKTALLIAVSCQLGAVAGKVSPDIHERLYRFGYYVGMAYQITDDILDFTSTEDKLGKPAGGDLLQGNVTLPVLYALKEPDLADRIKHVHEDMPTNDMAMLITDILQTNAIKKSSELSQRYLKKALHELDGLPPSRAKKSLRDIALFIGKRKY